MSRKSLNQTGFGAIEGLLVLIIVLLIGFIGYYVHHTQQQTDAINDAATKVAQSSPAKGSIKKVTSTTSTSATQSSQQYVTIKEWGVRAPYSGALHITYTMGNDGGSPPIDVASFTSTEVGGGSSCVASGGIVERANANTVLDDGGTTAGQANSPYTTTHLGNYYYVYIHPQGLCSGSDDSTLQSVVADAVKSLVQNLQAY